MLPASPLGWKHASLHAWIQRGTGAPGRETSIGRRRRITPSRGLCGVGLLVAPWILTLWVWQSQALDTAARQMRNKGLKSCFKGLCQNYFTTFFSSPSFSLPLLKGCPVDQLGRPPCLFRTPILSPSSVQAAYYNNLSFITSAMPHPLQDEKGGGATILILKGSANGVNERLSTLFKVTKPQTWDLTWLCYFPKQ